MAKSDAAFFQKLHQEALKDQEAFFANISNRSRSELSLYKQLLAYL